jgi:transposase InsO family protein
MVAESFKSVYPCEIKVWQSDNGSENLGEFDKALKKDSIPHLFSYPRCPKINAEECRKSLYLVQLLRFYDTLCYNVV